MTHPIPNAALDDRLGFIGTAGSGKTYNSGGTVERLLHKNARVVIVDPLGVWWGLRLKADGKKQSPFTVAIFGGAHGDLPLNEHAGALIGETAATMAESCIIDLSQLGTKSSERRFMTAFLETIYRKAGGTPFHLVVDEADLFAPQKPPKGDETLLNLMEQIVRRGRVKGFIPWLISQRPAVLNKNVLSQVDGLIAFKLTASQDRDALDGWIEGQADKAQGKAIKDNLPTLQTGQGVVWVPGRGVLRTLQFPPKETFDSSRTPKRGEKVTRGKKLKPLNLDKLQAKLATVEAETKANDPKALRSEVADLKREIAKLTYKSTTAAPVEKIDKGAIKRAEREAYARGEAETAPIWFRRGVEAAIGGIRGYVKDFNLPDFVKKELRTWKHIGALPPVKDNPAPIAQAAHPKVTLIRQPAPVGDGTFSTPQLKVLRSLAMWRALGHEAPTREMVAAVAGYKPGTGNYNAVVGSLVTAGAVGKPGQGCLSLLADGIEVISVDQGRAMLIDSLSRPQRKLVAALVDAGTKTREQLATDTGYQEGTGNYNALVGSLNSIGVTYKPSQGQIALSDWAQGLLCGHAERIAA